MKTAPRPLPRSLDPLPGESLAGFILRLAHRLAISPAHLAVITGLTASTAAIPISTMLALDAGTADTFARAARLSAGEAHALTLARYARCYPPARPSPQQAPTSAATTWQLTTFSRYCPACLAGDGSPVQQQQGRYPITCACPRGLCLTTVARSAQDVSRRVRVSAWCIRQGRSRVSGLLT